MARTGARRIAREPPAGDVDLRGRAQDALLAGRDILSAPDVRRRRHAPRLLRPRGPRGVPSVTIHRWLYRIISHRQWRAPPGHPYDRRRHAPSEAPGSGGPTRPPQDEGVRAVPPGAGRGGRVHCVRGTGPSHRRPRRRFFVRRFARCAGSTLTPYRASLERPSLAFARSRFAAPLRTMPRKPCGGRITPTSSTPRASTRA